MKSFDYITKPDNFLQIVPRILSTIIVQKICKTKITPTQITIVRGIFNLFALVFFVIGDYISLIFAFFTFQINEILDHVDGDLARLKNAQSKKGLFLEHLIDIPGSTTYGLFGLCVSIGIYRNTHNFNIFFVFIAILIGFALKICFSHVFGLEKERESFQHTQHGTYVGIRQNRLFKEKLLTLLKVIFIWENQIILWAALLYYPIEKYLHFNPLFLGMIIIAFIHQLSWLRVVYFGYKNVISK